jgi:hypothetical protein
MAVCFNILAGLTVCSTVVQFITRLNIRVLCILFTQWIFVFRVIFRISSCYFCKQNWRLDVCIGAHCVFCEARAKLLNVTEIVLQRSYRSVGGLLDLSHVGFMVDKITLGQVFILVFPLSVSFQRCSVFRAVLTVEGQTSEAC